MPSIEAFYRTPKAIYIASKAAYRPGWRIFRDQLKLPIISRWIDQPDYQSDDQVDFPRLWTQCIEDVQACDTLIAYVGEPSEELKGVLVEVGAALALDIPVILFGDPLRSQGTWKNHPGIKQYGATVPPMKSLTDYFAHHYG